ncbi:MAG: hypothetical protein QXS42_04485 [Zestosphaera sp.]
MYFKKRVSLVSLINSPNEVGEEEIAELMRQGFKELRTLGKPNKILLIFSLILEDPVHGHQRLARVLRNACRTECYSSFWVKYLNLFRPTYSPLLLMKNLVEASSNSALEELLAELVRSLECDELHALRYERYLETNPSLIKHYINTVLTLKKCETLIPDALSLLNDSILYDMLKYEDVKEILRENKLKLVIKRKGSTYSGVEIYCNDMKIDAADLNILGFLKLHQQMNASQVSQ